MEKSKHKTWKLIDAQINHASEYKHLLKKNMTNKQITIKALRDIIWMARRYAEDRATYAPSMFNDAYDALRHVYGDEIEPKEADPSVRNFPYATDKMYIDGETAFDDHLNRKYNKK